ncbi:MAG: M56 family metallopeptidase [Clostridium sp.]|nr:M56 family metallopeptidase [Clostridium sp.]
MSELFQTVLIMSITGTVMSLLLFALKPLIHAKLPKTIQYYLWLVVIGALLIPISKLVRFPQNTDFPVSPAFISNIVEQTIPTTQRLRPTTPSQTGENPKPAPTAAPSSIGENSESTSTVTPSRLPSAEPTTDNMTFILDLLFIAYPVVALSIILYYLASYLLFYIKLRRSSVKTTTFYSIPIYESPSVQTPLLVGFFSPRIVLPKRDYTPDQLRTMLLHEIVHLRRKDIFMKWLSVMACAVHWFNPFVWFVRGEINRICELACDEAVIDELEINERQLYGDTLILVAADYQPSRVTLAMSESKRNLKERLGAIMNHKKRTRSVVIVSVLLIVTNMTTAILLGAGNTNASNNANDNATGKLANASSLTANDHSKDTSGQGQAGNDDPADTTGQAGTVIGDPSQETGQPNANSTPSPISRTPDTLIDWKFIESEYDAEKSLELRENRETQVMLGEKTCTITFEDIMMEGSWYIKLVSITLEGKEYPYVIHDYDATFLKLAILDSVETSGKSVPILLLFFDTHGNGGQGTHDILMLTPDDDNKATGYMKATGLYGGFFNDHVDQSDYNRNVTFSANKEALIPSADGQRTEFTIDFSQSEYFCEMLGLYYDERELYQEPSSYEPVDLLYEFALIDWNGEERLLIYQYFTHTTGFGDVVSVVNMQEYPYQLEYQQIEIYPEFQDTVIAYRE